MLIVGGLGLFALLVWSPLTGRVVLVDLLVVAAVVGMIAALGLQPADAAPEQLDADDERGIAPSRVMPSHPRPPQDRTPPSKGASMSNLVAIAYPDQATADEVVATLARLQTEHAIQLDDAVVVDPRAGRQGQAAPDDQARGHRGRRRRAVGRPDRPHLLRPAARHGGRRGHRRGTGALTDVGVDDSFMKDLGAKLQPGSAALIVLVHRSTPDKVLPEIAQFGGDVIQTSLDNETEQRLRHILEARDASAV